MLVVGKEKVNVVGLEGEEREVGGEWSRIKVA